MKGWMVAVCCAGLLLCGCGAEEVQAPQSAVPQTEAVRVACVGDSITQGFGGHSYVAVLAEADGEAVYGNFGVCGQRHWQVVRQAMPIPKPMLKAWHGGRMWWCSCSAPMIPLIGKGQRPLKRIWRSWRMPILIQAHRCFCAHRWRRMCRWQPTITA